MRKIKFSIFTLLSLLLLLILPNTTFSKVIKGEFKPAPAAPAGYSTVYVYRLKTQSGNLDIFVDDEPVAKMGKNTYTWFYASPGQHTLKTKGNMWSSVPGAEVVVNIVPGAANYFKLQGRRTMTGMFSKKQTITTFAAIRTMPENEAITDLGKIRKYSPATQERVGKESKLKLSSTQQTRVSSFEFAQPPKPGYALVYFYRPQSVSLSGSPRIIVDDKEYFKMKGDSYTWLYMKPGMHSVIAKWAFLNKGLSSIFPLTVSDGGTYFLRYGSVGGDSLHKIHFQEVESTLAKKEFLTLKKYIKPKSEYVK